MPADRFKDFNAKLDEAQMHYAINLGDALVCLEHLLARADAQDAPRLLQALQLRGQIRTAQGHFMVAMEDLVRAQQLAVQAADNQAEAQLLCLIGNIYILQGLYPDAMAILLDAVHTLESGKSNTWLARALNSLGFTYHFLGQHAKAVSYLERSIQLARETGDLMVESLALDSLANSKLSMGQEHEALIYIRRSILLLRSLGHEEYLAEYLVTLAKAEDDVGEDGSASLHEALALARRLQLPRHEAQTLYYMGLRQVRFESHNVAEELLTNALDLACKTGDSRLVYLAHQQLSILLQQQERYREALLHYQGFHEKKEALLGEAAERRLQYLEIRHRIHAAEDAKHAALKRNKTLEEEVRQRTALQKKAEKLARIDSLTGLYNRRHFRHCAEQLLQEALQKGMPLSLILFDADHFKQINDTWGHAVGDQALQAISLNLLDSTRREDLFGRYGGEEFIMLMPNTTTDQALEAARRMLFKVERQGLPLGDATIPLTLSAGIAGSCRGQHISLDQLIKSADQALYLAKNKGRNQAVLAEA